MCTRILNSLDRDFPVTARNMDWFNPINVHFYTFPKGQTKFGLSKPFCIAHNLNRKEVLSWNSAYASISSVMGDDIRGFATVDGMNSEGLAVNALYDTDASYTPIEYRVSASKLSVRRWAQFSLDCFYDVKSAVKYFTQNDLLLVNEHVPDGSNMEGRLHLALSDSSGDSAIIEVRDGAFKIHHNMQYCVVTNQPSYDMQLNLDTYWQYVWGKSETKNDHPVYTAPGGNTSTQRFERASYYLSFSESAKSKKDAVTQARSLVATCSVPEHFNPEQKDHASYTIWSNISAHKMQTYYFLNTFTMSSVWLNFAKLISQCQRVSLVEIADNGDVNCLPLSGNVSSQLVPCKDPYSE